MISESNEYSCYDLKLDQALKPVIKKEFLTNLDFLNVKNHKYENSS